MQTLLVLVAMMTFAADPMWELQLTTGDVLRGRLVERSADIVVLEHPVLGRLTIPAGFVQELRELPATGSSGAGPPAAPAPLTGDAVPTEQQVMDDAIVVEPVKKVKGSWDSKFSLGLNSSSGKTTEGSLRVSLDSVFREASKKVTFDSFYLYKQTDGDATENKFTAGLRGDWPFTGSVWGRFVQGRYDFDEFQSWRHRVTTGAGLTYLLVDVDRLEPAGDSMRTDALTLTANAGIGINKEFGSKNTDAEFEGIFGLDFAWAISQRQRITIDGTFFPGLSDTGKYRFVSRGGWSSSLDRLDGMSLNLGYHYEFQSRVDPGVNPNDLQFYVTIGIDF